MTGPPSATSTLVPAERRRRRRAPGSWRVWAFTFLLAGTGGVLVWYQRDWHAVHPTLEIPWWAIGIAFSVAELSVIHLRFRQDAHSFSMSEIPLIVGLFFTTPLGLVAAQGAGSALVLTFHRRQPPMKLAFNMAQFVVQSALAVVTFRAVAGLGDPLGPAGWAAACAGAMVALTTANVLVNAVIRLSGGRLATREILRVVAFGAAGAWTNTLLALVAVLVLTARPDAAWIAAMPPVVLFFAYRAYMTQRDERARLQALYETTRALHASPQLESALAAAAAHAREMFDGEVTEITIFPASLDGVAYRTSSGPGDRRDSMRPIPFGAEVALWRKTLASPEPLLLAHSVDGIHVDGITEIRDAMMSPLIGSKGLVGAIVVANRLGDVSTFGPADLRLLETIASQISVSLENGRLEDSLAQLTSLKERLEALVRSKDEFVASVSHELRTPLTAVVGLAQELRLNRAAFSDDEFDELMAIIADQSGELSNIVEDLLVAARAEIGTLSLHPATLDVRRELQSLVSAHLARVHGTEGIVVHGTPPSIVADPLRFRQILRNLLTNASRYGGDRVWIEAEATGDTLVVSVLDDGPGVPDGSVTRIFEAYERAHNATTQPSSVGLGLAVSRQLARLMGGDLRYQRRDGSTAFVLTLPLGGPELPQASAPSRRPAAVLTT